MNACGGIPLWLIYDRVSILLNWSLVFQVTPTVCLHQLRATEPVYVVENHYLRKWPLGIFLEFTSSVNGSINTDITHFPFT